MRKILEKVLARIQADEINGHIEEVNGADTLRILPEMLGPNHNAGVVMEVCRIPVKDVEECGYYQFYTTVVVELDKERYPEILMGLNELNLTSLLGNYNILSDSAMLYHKAIMRLPNLNEEDMVEAILGTAYDCLAIIDYDYENIMKIVAGQ